MSFYAYELYTLQYMFKKTHAKLAGLIMYNTLLIYLLQSIPRLLK